MSVIFTKLFYSSYTFSFLKAESILFRYNHIPLLRLGTAGINKMLPMSDFQPEPTSCLNSLMHNTLWLNSPISYVRKLSDMLTVARNKPNVKKRNGLEVQNRV